jgi:hypothetical protein
MAEENFKYIIKNKAWNLYLEKATNEIYSPLFQNSIHDEIPFWVKGERHLEVIRSDDKRFKDLTKHLKEISKK